MDNSPFIMNVGRTNYVGVVGCFWESNVPVFAPYSGVFGNRSRLTLGQLTVQDGTSNTLFFGETLGKLEAGLRKMALNWWSCGSLPTAFGLGKPPYTTFGSFSSRHTAGVQFAICDLGKPPISIRRTGMPYSRWQAAGMESIEI
jgi:hypothetical protein